MEQSTVKIWNKKVCKHLLSLACCQCKLNNCCNCFFKKLPGQMNDQFESSYYMGCYNYLTPLLLSVISVSNTV